MSLALSALVRPCVYVRAALLCFACMAVTIALLQVSAAPGAFRLALPGTGLTLAAGVGLFFSRRPDRNLRRIDISGGGQMRLTVYQGLALAGAEDGVKVRLLPGSTLWPNLLLLRLADAEGSLTVLTIWPGSVTAPEFRALALACRAIAARSMETR